VQLTDRLGRAQQAGGGPTNRPAELREDLALAGEDGLLAVEHHALAFLEGGREVALRAGQRLLALVAVRDGQAVGVADLQVVAEGPVEANLTGLDTGGF